jgi:nitroreductase
MDVFEAIQERHSIRSYETKPVPRGLIEKVLEAAHLAPSARNIEPWHFIVVTKEEKRKQLSRGKYAKFLAQAPLVIVACGDKKTSPEWYAVDVALAVENMILTAIGEGLGTCCVGSFDKNEVRTALGIPENFEVVVLLAIGYSAEKIDLSRRALNLIRTRKTLSEVTSEEEFSRRFLPKKLTYP